MRIILTLEIYSKENLIMENEAFLNIVKIIEPRLLVTIFPKDYIKDLYLLIEHNEYIAALENLCTNLFEFNIPISKEEFNNLRDISEAYGLRMDYLKPLKELINL
jgi:hypothetical protein